MFGEEVANKGTGHRYELEAVAQADRSQTMRVYAARFVVRNPILFRFLLVLAANIDFFKPVISSYRTTAGLSHMKYQ
ncbi:hypothetical protein Y032_0080g1369 [Ancylostoma ceylanicum]|uniref:Uncharacterized protein n=1 Tax=Ancylostoma ceylanicum TaxID=53326 RepID=A0A016TSR4_9BILA|nr:hypothetical protein Y032_0080g1369 [Ancylostoma ceylanicum]